MSSWIVPPIVIPALIVLALAGVGLYRVALQ